MESGIKSPLCGPASPFGLQDGLAVDRPVITVPGAQAILLSSAPLVFASSISVSFAPDSAGTVVLTFIGGTITLDGTTGLTGDTNGADGTIAITGSETDVNNALSGMAVSAGSVGDRTLAIAATNTQGTRNASVAVQFGSVPANTVAPAISGTLTIGSTLTSSTGTFTGHPAPTLTYQWQRDGSNIGGATAATYVLAMADFEADITCEVTATNAYGSDTEETASITPTDSVPVNTVSPAISGDLDYGGVLTCSTGTWTGVPTPTLTYQWQRNGSNIVGATSNTYTSVFSDVGDSITCEVTATNVHGSAMVETAAVVVIDPDAPEMLDFSVNTNSQYIPLVFV